MILFWLVWLTLLWAALWDYRKKIIPHMALLLLLAYAVVWGWFWVPFLIMIPGGLILWRINYMAPGDCKLFTVLAASGWWCFDLLLLLFLFRDLYRAVFLWLKHRPASLRGLWCLMQTEEVPMAPLFVCLWLFVPFGPVAALASFY